MTSSSKNNAPLLTWFATSMVVLWLLIAIGPFIWTVWGSFKVEGDFFSKADWRNAIYGVMTIVETGGSYTGNGYYGAWIEEEFWFNVFNTTVVVFFTVTISLTMGTLGGYALARSGFRYAFWLLILALIFRAMPHITLVSGYLLPFFEWNVWGKLSTTFFVLVAILILYNTSKSVKLVRCFFRSCKVIIPLSIL